MLSFVQKNAAALRVAAAFIAVSFTFYLSGILLAVPGLHRESETDTGGESVTVILDAGHGGEDAGTIGENGVLEKDLNLLMAEEIALFLRAAGVTVILTRTEDKLLYKESENIKGYRKIYDLRNRLLVARAYPEALFVSLHMNAFPAKQYSGTQVYYSQNTEESRHIAQEIQAVVQKHLQPENNREIKPAGDSIYLLDEAESPAVLIECGFLSNPEECERLTEEDYRKRLSFLISCAIMNTWG